MKSQIVKIGAVSVCIGILFTGAAFAGHGNYDKRQDRSEKMWSRLADKLNLTEAQQTELKALRDQQLERRKDRREMMTNYRQQMQDVVNADSFDQAQAESLARTLTREHESQMVSKMKNRYQMRQVLTPEQREQLSQLCDDMKDRKARKGHGRYSQGMHGFCG